MGLLERERETELLAGALADTRSGRGAAVLVEGEAGIGKTLLLDFARREGHARGVEVLSARGMELEQSFGWGVVRQLFERWLLSRPTIDRERLLNGPAEPAAGPLGIANPGAATEAFAAVHGLYWLVVNASEEQPLALLVDDVQWADQASVGWLAYMASRIERLPVALLLALRRPDPAADSELLTRIALESTRIARPFPLSEDAARELIGERPLLAGEPELAAACHQASGGNPFLLRALLDELSELAVHRAPDPADVRVRRPEEISRSVLLRLGRLSRDASNLARALAILGGAATTARAADLAGVGHGEASSAVAALVAAGILTDTSPPTFVHPLVHGAVLGDAPEPVRAAWHARAAVLLRQSGAPLEEIAAQLVQAEPAAAQEVVDTLCAAATVALSNGAPQGAVHLLQRAAREPPLRTSASRVQRLLGRALIREQGAAGLQSLEAAVEAASDPRERVEAALELARALEGLARNVEATAVYERILRELPAADDQRRTVQAGLAVAAAQNLSTLPRALETVSAAFADLGEGRPVDPVMRATMALAVTAAGAYGGLEMAEAALADGALLDGDTSIAIGLALAPLVWGDQLDRALSAWDEVIASAQARGAPLRYAFAVTYRAELHLRAGRLGDAEADARAALEVPQQMWVSSVPVDTPAVLADILTQRGEFDQAERLLASAGPATGLSDYQGNNLLLMARGRLRLAQGRSAEAAEDLLDLGRRCEAFTLRNPAAVPWRSHAALAICHQDRERAIALADEEVELAEAFGAPRALGISLRASGLVRQGPESVELLRRAVEVLRDSPAQLELARALVDLGAAERRARERVGARRRLAEGLDLAAACGATPLVERARAELRTAGARPRRDRITGRDALTASELRVAGLASEGRTNREIAEALWVTLSTIEVHLTRVYRKLDITERVELGNALQGIQPPD
jgi:DNA-binding CsgD family transcriptional regulator/tetratricopeptide (TPR) repeat protein